MYTLSLPPFLRVAVCKTLDYAYDIATRFEGDGMVHATRIKDGKASFCNHFVQTHKLKEEQRVKFPIYAKVLGRLQMCGLACLPPQPGAGLTTCNIWLVSLSYLSVCTGSQSGSGGG